MEWVSATIHQIGQLARFRDCPGDDWTYGILDRVENDTFHCNHSPSTNLGVEGFHMCEIQSHVRFSDKLIAAVRTLPAKKEELAVASDALGGMYLTVRATAKSWALNPDDFDRVLPDIHDLADLRLAEETIF